MDKAFTEMTYHGQLYKTDYGTYRVPHSDALVRLGPHRHQRPSREEFATYVDKGIQEAYIAYPAKKPWNDQFAGFSRSYYSKDAHVESLHMFQSTTRTPKPHNDKSWEAVDQHCFELFDSFPRVDAMDFDTQLKQVPFENTSSAGIGLPGKKGDPGNHKAAIKQACGTIYRAERGEIQDVVDNTTPDAAFVRTQLSDLTKGSKVRHVFGQAFQYIILEGLFVVPLLQMFMSIDSPYFIGTDPRVHVPTFIEFLTSMGLDMMSIDWSGFDQQVEDWEITDVFKLFERILNFPNGRTKLAFDLMMIIFINRKIAGPDGMEYMKHRGVPSGSYYTNIVDSWVNYRRIQYIHHRLTGRLIDPKHIKICGDDGCFGLHQFLNVNPFKFELITYEYPRNWILRAEKMAFGRSSDQIGFLQRYLKFGDHRRDTERTERLAMFPEYEIIDKKVSAYRARALWEDGNYESNFLAFATAYLEQKYGKITHDQAPMHVRRWRDKVFAPIVKQNLQDATLGAEADASIPV